MQVTIDTLIRVAKKPKSTRRSGCPVGISLEVIGDRWSLLIVRDLMVRGCNSFKEFLEAGEGIATNILSDRLHKLEAAQILTADQVPGDARKIHYRLTEKGIDLAPVVLDLLLWASRYEATGAPCEVMAQMANNREEVLSETYRRWKERDATPLLPKFGTADVSNTWRKSVRKTDATEQKYGVNSGPLDIRTNQGEQRT